MRHAILGAGGIGGLIGTILSAGGEQVTAVVRAASVASEPRDYQLEHDGTVTARGPVTVVSALGGDDAVDVLWITPKATQVRAALASVSAATPRAVVPLLNGIDHVAVLRETFGDAAVVPATIAVGADKVAPGRFRQLSPFASLEFAQSGHAVLAESARILEGHAIAVRFEADETTLLWKKLSFLAPFALTTSAALKPIGYIRDTPAWWERMEAALREVAAVARASGASIDEADARTLALGAPAALTSSMSSSAPRGTSPRSRPHANRCSTSAAA